MFRNRYDSRRKSCAQKSLLRPKECREHHYGSDGRCKICSIRADYFAQCMATLNGWDKKSKVNPNEHWQEKVDNLKCDPHTHDPHHGAITEAEHFATHDPLHQLYNMEGTQ